MKRGRVYWCLSQAFGRRELIESAAKMGDAVHSESGTNAAKKLTAGKLRSVCAANPQRNPDQPCDYVGMTGLTPKERFTNHKAGMKDAYVVRRFGVRLMPELYAHVNPMSFEAAAEMEDRMACGVFWYTR